MLGIFICDTFFFLDIEDYVNFKNKTGRKSIPLDFIEEHGIEIKKHKLQKYFKFELDKYFNIE